MSHKQYTKYFFIHDPTFFIDKQTIEEVFGNRIALTWQEISESDLMHVEKLHMGILCLNLNNKVRFAKNCMQRASDGLYVVRRIKSRAKIAICLDSDYRLKRLAKIIKNKEVNIDLMCRINNYCVCSAGFSTVYKHRSKNKIKEQNKQLKYIGKLLGNQ